MLRHFARRADSRAALTAGKSSPTNTPMMAMRNALSADAPVMSALVTLRDATLPSQREMAAEQLASLDWRMQPSVIPALLMAAKADPAATVRAGCVRVLGRMKASSPDVVATLQALKDDRDERVRQEVAQVLPVLCASPVAQDSGVRPATATQRVP